MVIHAWATSRAVVCHDCFLDLLIQEINDISAVRNADNRGGGQCFRSGWSHGAAQQVQKCNGFVLVLSG